MVVRPKFERIPLLTIKWKGMTKVPRRDREGKYTKKKYMWWLYHRYSNARGLYVGPLHIVWRWFWSLDAVYQTGWDHGFMQRRNGIDD